MILAVPKTGTTALAAALGPSASMVIREPPELKHAPVYRYRRYLQPFFEKAGRQRMETLAVVREPVSWLGSWYRYRARAELAGHPNSTAGMTFSAFVEGYLATPRPDFARVGGQARFLAGEDGGIGVDHLFRYESPGALAAFLETRLGRPVDTVRRNVSPPAVLALDPGVEARLRVEAAAEFEVWAQGR